MEEKDLQNDLENVAVSTPNAPSEEPVITAEPETAEPMMENSVVPQEPVDIEPANISVPVAEPITEAQPKKKSGKAALIVGLIAAALILVIGIGAVVWFMGADDRIIDEAELLIDDEDYEAAYNRLAEVKKQEKAKSSYKRIYEEVCNKIDDCIEDAKYDAALELLDDNAYIFEELDKETADVQNEIYEGIESYIVSLMDGGDYVGALAELEKYAELSNYETLYSQIRFETYTLACVLDVRSSFKNPSSVQVSSVEFYDTGLGSPYPGVIVIVSAQNGFGGYGKDLLLFDDDDLSYMGSCDTLDTSEADDFTEYLVILLVESWRDYDEITGAYDLNRVNKILSDGITPKYDITEFTIDGDSAI